MNRVMTESADVVVIGGGIMGLSTAWELAKRGAGKIVVLERAVVAAGATGKTGALLRQHYSNEPEARLAHLSLQVFRNWSEIVGGDCGHVPTGVVLTVEMGPGSEANADRMRRNIAMQNRLGIESQVVTPDELKELQPYGYFDDLVIASYEPASGYVDSIATARTLGNAATRDGVDIREGSGIRSIGRTATASRASKRRLASSRPARWFAPPVHGRRGCSLAWRQHSGHGVAGSGRGGPAPARSRSAPLRLSRHRRACLPALGRAHTDRRRRRRSA